jgi:CheY-like chemotaxis protein
MQRVGRLLYPQGDQLLERVRGRPCRHISTKGICAKAVGQAIARNREKNPRILLVDDDVCVKKLFFSRFENLGAELLYAVDGVRGFWVARREEPTVIVSDYCMPNGDAECLLIRLRSVPETSSIPVIVQTGRRLNDLIKQRLRRSICGLPGATRILRKSSDTGELFEALQRLCGFASGLDGELALQMNARQRWLFARGPPQSHPPLRQTDCDPGYPS